MACPRKFLRDFDDCICRLVKYYREILSLSRLETTKGDRHNSRYFFDVSIHGAYSPAEAETRYSNHLVTVYRIVYKGRTTINRPRRTPAYNSNINYVCVMAHVYLFSHKFYGFHCRISNTLKLFIMSK